MLVGKAGLRLSLAGALDKQAVVFNDARIERRQKSTLTFHILKPAFHAVEGLASLRSGTVLRHGLYQGLG